MPTITTHYGITGPVPFVDVEVTADNRHMGMRKAQKAVAPGLGGAGGDSYLSRGLRGLHGCQSAPLGESPAPRPRPAARRLPLGW